MTVMFQSKARCICQVYAYALRACVRVCYLSYKSVKKDYQANIGGYGVLKEHEGKTKMLNK